MARSIKEVRMERGISQARVAEMAGVSQAQIARIEQGHRSANPIIMARIATALGMSVEDITPIMPDRQVPDNVVRLKPEPAPPWGKVLLKIPERWVTPEQAQAVFKILDGGE